jgi:hypothetical protein
MTGVWQDMNISPGQRSVRSGNDPIFLSPDYANWFTEIRKFLTQHYPLLIPIENCGENRFQGGLDPIYALKSKQIFDKSMSESATSLSAIIASKAPTGRTSFSFAT